MAFYRKKQLQEMVPWDSDIPDDLFSISYSDELNGSPKAGDMIAISKDDPTDMWLVSEQLFKDNYEWVCDV